MTKHMPEYIQIASLGYQTPFAISNESYVDLKQGELLKLTGVAIPLNKISGNNRKYVPETVHLNVAKLQPRIALHALFGELDHPITADINRMAYVQMTNVSHRIDRLWYDKSKDAYMIEITVLDTPSGNIVYNIYQSGSPIFISLRSLLNPKKNKQNEAGYIDAYMMALITVDIVSNPGFSDAMLEPIASSNEAMLAVCESLNIFNTNDMKTSNEMYKIVDDSFASESVAGVACQPNEADVKTINDLVRNIRKALPAQFTVEDFVKNYRGLFYGNVVGLYPDASVIELVSDSCRTILKLDMVNTNKFSLPAEPVIKYLTIDSNAVDGKHGQLSEKSAMYPVISTEDYVPQEAFVTKLQEVAKSLRETGENISKDAIGSLLDTLSDKFGVVFRMDEEDDEPTFELKVTDASGDDAGSIMVTKDEDAYRIGDIVEFWQPGTEDISAAESIQLFEIVESSNEGMYAIVEDKYEILDGNESMYQVVDEIDETEFANESNGPEIAYELFQIVPDGMSNDKRIINAQGERGIVKPDNAEPKYAVVNEEADGSKPSMYSIVENEDAVNDKEQVNPDEPKRDKKPAKADVNETDWNQNELAMEAATIFELPSSKFSEVYAIENMPVAYKHLWNGLTPAAKELLAKQSEKAKDSVAVNKFWANVDFIATERLCINSNGSLEAALESVTESKVNPMTNFLKVAFRQK
jgi:hypothetical protein